MAIATTTTMMAINPPRERLMLLSDDPDAPPSLLTPVSAELLPPPVYGYSVARGNEDEDVADIALGEGTGSRCRAVPVYYRGVVVLVFRLRRKMARPVEREGWVGARTGR